MKNRWRMSVKLLTQLHILPWCFHLVRAQRTAAGADSDGEDDGSPEPIKVIKSDGQVSLYHRPVHASELMSEFPKHMLCHSDSFYIGQRIPALSEHDLLQLGHKYFLLPSHLFQSVLSFVTIASFVSSDAPAAKKAAAARHQLFDVHRTSSGGLRIRVSDEFISQLMAESIRPNEKDAAARDGECGGKGRVCTTARLEREYDQLVGGSRGRRWKPKLESIKERSEKKRGLMKSFGRNNSRPSRRPETALPSNKLTPRSKIRMRLRKC